MELNTDVNKISRSIMSTLWHIEEYIKSKPKLYKMKVLLVYSISIMLYLFSDSL
jgi:hypothetical protein